MTQSDVFGIHIGKLKAEIERLRAAVRDQAGVELSEENDRLLARIERLTALLQDALRGLHNDFEPDNQSALYKRIKAALDGD